ncbi:hypothetical protein SAMN04488030_1975 [Aliiroseovarius halocynthiae]|uniref:hypothetical protein n=1 Tax=Aliiroseovarius halocynthiae TaxID=985055 RepID=UPI00115E0587|nr:hypothetical protein [Aliiroseovarius halocynthiae]SMR81505.1 hypothetical protein SAMN04488030_1975 [Aliiroseovarius halocynthiae]
MKQLLFVVAGLALTACVTPTYKVPPYDGYKRVTFKANEPNKVFHYLCKPGSSDEEVWARGEKAHGYANQQRKEYYPLFLPRIKDVIDQRNVEERAKLLKDMESYWDNVEQTMEARYECIFYRTPDEARMGL